MQSVPCEYLELYFPLVIEKYELVEDSGGAGTCLSLGEALLLEPSFDEQVSSVGAMAFACTTDSWLMVESLCMMVRDMRDSGVRLIVPHPRRPLVDKTLGSEWGRTRKGKSFS
jgi:hypothetical protein